MQNQDLTACEREPIHIPGAIQGHGLFFGLREPELEIVMVSTNVPDFLDLAASACLGRPLSEILQTSSYRELQQALDTGQLEAANPLNIQLKSSQPKAQVAFDGIVHRSQGLLILELEPRLKFEGPSFFSFYHAVQQSMFRLEKAPTIESATQITAEEVARLTGFGRVMVYQFDEEWHGRVVAESLRPDLGMSSYLGLHFPQSDIPSQARRLYSLNSLRLIADVEYQPVPLLPALHPDSAVSLDLSHSTLRSVSPIHIEYLRNMKVSASMSISIMKDDKLWGLIACHHPEPHYVSFQVRSACRFIGQLIAQQIHTIEARATFEQRALIREKLTWIRGHFHERGLLNALPTVDHDLIDLVGASGAAFYLQNNWHRLGKTPEVEDLDKLLAWLRETAPSDVFSTHRLAKDFPEARPYAALASGLLAIPLSKAGGHLLWFKPEIVRTVYWAGEPRKVPTDAPNRLNPRTSFASWKEVLREQAEPWTKADVEAAVDLRTVLIAEELERLNSELKRSNAELDAFASIASHDLKEPLRGMRTYAQFIASDEGGLLSSSSQGRLETIQKLGERTELLIDGLYQYSRLGRIALAQSETDLDELVREVQLRLQVFFAERAVRLICESPLPRLVCDRVRVAEVYYNLLLNAAKYNDKADKWIRVGWREPDPKKGGGPILFVQDNGIGVPQHQQQRIFAIFKRGPGSEKFGPGSGTGLTLARRIIETHGGQLWLESEPGQGTTFYWTLGSQWAKPGEPGPSKSK